MFHNWLRGGSPTTRPSAKRNALRRSYRPQLEMLEQRCQPSVFQPIGAFPPIGADTQPAFIITFGPNGAITTTKTGQGPYDGIEDTYVGVRNLANSGTTVTKIHLTASVDIFGFDGDGIAAPQFGSPVSGPTGYEGPGTSFSNFSTLTAGDVSFNDGQGHGLLPGFQAFFSLEEVPNEINVTPSVQVIHLNSTVFFPYRPNYARPSNHVLAWIILTNPGNDVTGTITVNFSLPGVGIQPITATQHVTNIGVNNGTPFLTFSGGLKHGQSVAVEVLFTYPPSLSLDAIRKDLNMVFTTP
jgi:hypothetical protein